MAPKIPAFVKTQPPCDFADDPQQWIKWMEGEVSDYRDRKAQAKAEEEERYGRQLNFFCLLFVKETLICLEGK